MRVKNDISKFEAIDEIRSSYLAEFSFYRILTSRMEFLKNISLVLINSNNFIDGKASENRLIFEGVSDLKIGEINALLIPQIEIQDISAHQIEGVSFKVSEVENLMFTFLCSDFYVL